MPGSLTLKTEPIPHRDNKKRKIVAVPELLPERVELTKQSNEIEVEVEPIQIYLDNDGSEQEMLAEPIDDQSTIKTEIVGIGPQSTSGHIEIFEQRIINNSLSYTIPRTSVLVLTNDGNYVITKLDDDVNKTDEIEIPTPQVKEIIILNGSNDVQLTNMGVDYQTVQQTDYDDSR